MKLLSQLSHPFAALGNDFCQPTQAQAVKNPEWLSINNALADELDIPVQAINNPDFLSMMAGNLPSDYPSVASVYAGHQFGSYTPRLGDGRALLLGDWRDQQGNTWELQLKGSGITDYSRFGDGRAVLRSSIREYLASAALHGLGIPTTTALALINSQTPVQRESIETAAIVLRVAPSFIRFGHFEYFFYQNQHHALKQLADFTIKHYFPEHQGNYAAWFEDIVLRTARLIAQWQAVGFCHGVMNTDNMSILGLTIDYGPFAFLDEFDPDYICNHSDHTGRYSFNNQTSIGLWNLHALAHALSPLISQEQSQQSLALYADCLSREYEHLMLAKLALKPSNTKHDEILLEALFAYLIASKVDYSLFFRQLSESPLDALAANPVEKWQAWLRLYQAQLKAQDINEQARQSLMQQRNPSIILRSDLAQQAIEQAQAGNYRMVNDLLSVLQRPFEQHERFVSWSKQPQRLNRDIVLSCSS